MVTDKILTAVTVISFLITLAIVIITVCILRQGGML